MARWAMEVCMCKAQGGGLEAKRGGQGLRWAPWPAPGTTAVKLEATVPPGARASGQLGAACSTGGGPGG